MDRESFDRLLLENLQAGLRFAIRLTGDAASGEDLLHDAILRAIKASSGFRTEGKFTTWMFQIVVNCFRDRCRAKSTSELDEDAPDWKSPASSSGLDQQELRRMIANRVSSLPPKQREALVLVAFENMSISDAAEVLEMTETNVRVNLFHARQRLKQDLAEYLSPEFKLS